MGSGINTEDILDIWSPDNNKNMLEELKAGLGSTLKIMKRPFDIGRYVVVNIVRIEGGERYSMN